MENILSVEDQNFLSHINQIYGLENIICDENVLAVEENLSLYEAMFNDSSFVHLSEILKKLKYRINHSFSLNFSNSGFDIAMLS